jgi:glycosyltransferase involved in cell wall biosynthesis
VTRLEGQYTGDHATHEPAASEPVVLFAGRLIPEKRAPALVPAIAQARERIPNLRGEIYGDGPERQAVAQAIAEHGLTGVVTAPGFVDHDVLEQAISHALCLALPSSREGYGLVIVEAASRGVPVVVVDGPDNAATELVEDGANGVVARSASPEDLADAFVRIADAGPALRSSAVEWFRSNAERLSFDTSFERIREAYDAR